MTTAASNQSTWPSCPVEDQGQVHLGLAQGPTTLAALHDRVAALRHHVGDAVQVDGRILFSTRARFPKGQPPLSLTLPQLAAEVERIGGPREAGVNDFVQRAWDDLVRAQTPER